MWPSIWTWCQITKITSDYSYTSVTNRLHNVSQSDIAIFRIFKRRPPPSWIFEIVKFYWLFGSREWRCISMPNVVTIGQSVAKILRFFDFSRWRPSAILDLFGAYLDHQQWVFGVSITLQNLVMIDAVVFISCLRINVHNHDDNDDDNDNASQRGPLWPHEMGPTRSIWKMLGSFATASRLTPIHQGSLPVLSRAACNDNAWQRGPLWPHGMGPMTDKPTSVKQC